MKDRQADETDSIVVDDLTNDNIRLVNKAFAFTIQEVGISKSSGT